MSIPKFNVDVLDAILLPATTPSTKSHRKDAEKFYNSLTIFDRSQGLLEILVQLKSNAVSGNVSLLDNSADLDRINLAAVLLRKEISGLAGEAMKNGVASSTTLLDMVEPLLALYSQKCTIINRQSRRAIGYCLAELCLSMSLIATDNEAAEGIRNILSRIGAACAAGDTLSLKLLSTIATRAPVALWTSVALEDERSGHLAMGNLLTSAIDAIQEREEKGETSNESLEILMEAVFQVGIASYIAEQAAQNGDSAAVAEVSNAIHSQLKGTGSLNFLKINPNSFSAKLGHTCLSPLLKLILSRPNDDLYQSCAQHLSECASRAPSLLAGSTSTFKDLIEACLYICTIEMNPSQDELDAKTRLSALEVLVTLLECSEAKEILMKGENEELLKLLLVDKGNGFVGLCIQAMIDGVDIDVKTWAEEKPALHEEAVWENDDAALFAESILERFLKSLGGTLTIPIVLPMLESLVQSSEWQYQRAALAVMEMCLSTSRTCFTVHIPVVVNAAISLCNNVSTNVRVQWQCMQLLGVLCASELIETVQKPFGGNILASIARLVQNNLCRKVVSHACQALVSFCRCESSGSTYGIGEIIRPYAKDLLEALASGPLAQDYGDLQKLRPFTTVLIRSLGAVACLADTIREEFIPFYGNFMPGLIACAGIGLELKGTVLKNHQRGSDYILEEELAELRGAAVESASIIGQAVAGDDGEPFALDAEKIMSLALPILNETDKSKSAIPTDQLLAACARIASTMKHRFVPFLPTIIPYLLKQASQEVHVSISEGDEAGLEATQDGAYEQDSATGNESVTVSVPGIGLKKLSMNTTQIQEKANAARAIYELATSIGSRFSSYSEACVNVFLPLVHFKYSAEVRSTSAQALVPFFNSVCHHASIDQSQTSLVTFARKSLPLICKSILHQLKNDEEEDWEIIFAFAETISEVLYTSFSKKNVVAIENKDGEEIVGGLIVSIESCLERRSNLIGQINAVDELVHKDSIHELNLMLEKESDILSLLTDSIGYIIKILGPKFYHIFNNIVAPYFKRLLTIAGSNDIRARFAAICLFDDCVEHCGSTAAEKYSPILLAGILEGLDDTKNELDMDMKQASIYGVAQIARYAPPSVLSTVALPIIELLEEIIRTQITQTKEHNHSLSLMENAVSALASLTLKDGSPFEAFSDKNKKALIDLFIQALPLQQDYDEAKICHECFCELIEAKKLDTTSPKVILEIMRIFGECAILVADGEEVVSSETYNRFTIILKNMCLEVGDAMMQCAFETLPHELKSALQTML